MKVWKGPCRDLKTASLKGIGTPRSPASERGSLLACSIQKLEYHPDSGW